MSADFSRAPSLGGAFLGYEYQDVVAAGLLAVGLVEGLDFLATEIPRGSDTAFDDIEMRQGARTTRFQVKHSTDADRRLRAADLGRKGTLSLAGMAAAAAEEPATAKSYRVLLTWSEPDEDELAGLLVAAPDVQPALPGWATRRYRLDAEMIWPSGAIPASFSGLDVARADRAALVALCDRAVFEFAAPAMSRDLDTPGASERWLISYLANNVGLGRFPNPMSPEVAADRLVRLATGARPRTAAVDLARVRQRLELRTTFGRLEQLTPVEPAYEVRRRRQAARILRLAGTSPVTLLTAGPGAGKTWAIEEIIRLSRRAGAVVAKHYCYLRPDDTVLEERIRGDQMIAHLVADVIDQAPELADVGPTFAADLERLDRILAANAAADSARDILLIVDGLDHVGRIRARSRHLADADADLVERLASLDLPGPSHLLVLSQPGDHLAPLRPQGLDVELASWDDRALDDLARRLGVDAAALPTIADEAVALARQRCVTQAAGSPLYCTYLARSVLDALDTDPDCDIEEVMTALPPAGTELRDYYAFLLRQAAEFTPGARELAYLLGVADFALTATDLEQIVGPVSAPTVRRGLSALRPLLTPIGSELAFRIHHESFQRFIVETLEGEGVPVASVVAPLVRWLETRGLFADARAFRHLLPSLLRSAQPRELLDHVRADFVAKALAHGHPLAAVLANLAAAASAGTELRDPAALARCVELARAATSAYEDKLDAVEQFSRSYVQARGADAVAERLIFDGRPTWPRRTGLHLCVACDLAGGVPPWREYLQLPRHVASDVAGDDDEEERADRAGWLGRMRLADNPSSEAIAILRDDPSAAGHSRKALRHLAHVSGPEAVAEIVPQLVEGPPRLGGWIEVATAFHARGDIADAIAAADNGLAERGPPGMLHEAIEQGGDARALTQRLGPVDRAVELAGQLAGVDDVHNMRPVVELMLRLRVHGANGVDLAPIRAAVTGGAWWHDWLRFCVDEAAGGIEGDRLAALRRLAADAHPYAGSPRAMDLWDVRGEIANSIERLFVGLPVQQIAPALQLLAHLAQNTGGAYNLTALLNLCDRHLDRAPAVIGEFAIAQISSSMQAGEDLYETMAEHTLRLADFHLRAGRHDQAGAAWLRAAELLAAYGYRKDVTLFDLIESLPHLAAVDCGAALERATRLQEYASLVVHHTDGRETDHAPAAWYAQLSRIHPSVAAQSLAVALRRRGGVQDYRLEEGLVSLLDVVAELSNARLLEAIGCTVRGASESRRVVAQRLLDVDRCAGEDAVVRLIAAVDGDSHEPQVDEVQRLVDWARSASVAVDEPTVVLAARPVSAATPPAGRYGPSDRTVSEPTPLVGGEGVGALLRTMRKMRFGGDGAVRDERFVLAFGLRLVEFAQDDRQATAARLLRAFAHELRGWETSEPLVWLAAGLERHGQPALAAQALVYSWTCARQRWWQRTGGAQLSGRIVQARALDTDIAGATLMAEIADVVRTDPRAVGVAKGLVGLLAALGEHADAFATWDAAAEVIFARLPALGDEPLTFAAVADLDHHLPLDDALAQVLAARVSHPYTCVAQQAVGGLVRVTQVDPDVLVSAIGFSLEADTTVLVLEAALSIALCSPHAALVAQTHADQLYGLAQSDSFLLRRQAIALLEQADIAAPRARRGRLARPPLLLGDGPMSRATLSLDWEHRVDALDELIPGFSEALVARFEHRWRTSEVAKQREKSRWRLRSSAAYELPGADVRLWATEVFESALQDELAASLAAQPSADADAALRLVRPPVRMLAAWAAGRTTRPPPPQPTEIIRPLVDGRYAGWWRLGWIEQELVPDTPHYTVTSKRFAIGAVVFSNEPVPSEAVALGDGQPGDWWSTGTRSGTWPGLISPRNAFTNVAFQRDPWGSRTLLMLPQPVAAALPLRPDPGTRPALLDNDGNEAVRMRRWWVRPFAESGGAAWVVRLTGCDLIVRDDVWREIQRLAVDPPRWVHQETTTQLDLDDE